MDSAPLQPLLMALNRAASAYTGYAKVPESLDLKVVVQVVRKEAEETGNKALAAFAQALYENMEKRPLDKYLAYRKVRKANKFGKKRKSWKVGCEC